ncbi:MAG: hypothetical protein LBU32_09535 [Clostridiales bacterium]|nr:hypothetical protein [Clostridiales bacterium]
MPAKRRGDSCPHGTRRPRTQGKASTPGRIGALKGGAWRIFGNAAPFYVMVAEIEAGQVATMH